MKYPLIKIFTQILLVVVYVSLSFAKMPVTITVHKNEMEADLKQINIYQEDSETAFVSIPVSEATENNDFIWHGDVTVTNGVTSFCADAEDLAGNKSAKSGKTIFDPPPDSPTITLKIEVE